MVVDTMQHLCSARKRKDISQEFPIALGPRCNRLRTVMPEKFWDQLVATHPDQAMDGVHRSPLTDIPERSRPSERVEIVRVAQRAVDVEQNPGPKMVRHAGGSFSRFVAACSSPVR